MSPEAQRQVDAENQSSSCRQVNAALTDHRCEPISASMLVYRSTLSLMEQASSLFVGT